MILRVIFWDVVKCNESIIMGTFDSIKNRLLWGSNTHHNTLLLNFDIIVLIVEFNLLEKLVSTSTAKKIPHRWRSWRFFIGRLLWLVIWYKICSFEKGLESIDYLICFCATLNNCLVLLEKFLAGNWLIPDLLVVVFNFLLNSFNWPHTRKLIVAHFVTVKISLRSCA